MHRYDRKHHVINNFVVLNIYADVEDNKIAIDWWAQNMFNRRVDAVSSVDRWWRYQPVAQRLSHCVRVAYAEHTLGINSDNLEAICYTDL